MQSPTETTPNKPGTENNETSEFQVNHIHCESADDHSDTENPIIIFELRIENEYETPVQSDHY